MDVRRFGFQSWDDGTRLYRASRGPAILPHPLLRLEPCRCWCGAGANQPTQPNPPDSLSFACTSASQPTALLLHLLLLRSPLPPSPPPLPHRLVLVLVLILFLLHLLLLLLLLLPLLLLLLLLLPLLLCHPRLATHCYLPLSFTSTYCFSFSCLRSSVSQTTTPPSPPPSHPSIAALSVSSEVTHTSAYISPFRPSHRCHPHFPQQSPTQANRAKS